MDNILKMMETHANNLESTVNERTRMLLEEKKKTDVLLYRLLPAWVLRHQLMFFFKILSMIVRVLLTRCSIKSECVIKYCIFWFSKKEIFLDFLSLDLGMKQDFLACWKKLWSLSVLLKFVFFADFFLQFCLTSISGLKDHRRRPESREIGGTGNVRTSDDLFFGSGRIHCHLFPEHGATSGGPAEWSLQHVRRHYWRPWCL